MSAERLRRIHKLLFFAWIFPGLPIAYLLRDSLTFIVFISVYAVVGFHFISWRQEHKDPESDPD